MTIVGIVWVLMFRNCGILVDQTCEWMELPSYTDACSDKGEVLYRPGPGNFRCEQRFVFEKKGD